MHELVTQMKEFVAVDAVGTSALRRQGPGVLTRIRRCLAGIKLERIPRNETAFKKWLGGRTRHLCNRGGCKWGTARKALNLFLRACFYHHYLRRDYGLKKIERWLEIPLDSVVAAALKREAGRGCLPRWLGLKWLTPTKSERFQTYAGRLARTRGLPARVHLDVFLWLDNR